MLGIQKHGVAYAMAYAPQATRRIQIPEQHISTWLPGESGPGLQLSEGCCVGLILHTGRENTLPQ